MSLHLKNIFRNNITLKLRNLSAHCSGASRASWISTKQRIFLFVSSSWLSILVNHVSLTINIQFILNKMYGIPSKYFHKLKNQWCKCTMVNLQHSLIVCSFLFLFIHHVILLQQLVETSASIEVKNP